MRTPIIAGNWKMNTGLDEARDLARSVRDRVSGLAEVERVLVPPFPWIVPVYEELVDTGVTVGAQNCHFESSGAFTGEVAASMLDGLCSHIIVGHSERRQIFGETDEVIAKKLSAVLHSGNRVILCVGETLAERESGAAEQTVRRQLDSALEGIAEADARRIVIAYEPVWAIGTGRAASVADAQDMASFIRARVADRISTTCADQIQIQYGGSVKGSNAAELMQCPDVDGALVGGASLDPEDFASIVGAAAATAN